jgi:hypothetical protein
MRVLYFGCPPNNIGHYYHGSAVTEYAGYYGEHPAPF